MRSIFKGRREDMRGLVPFARGSRGKTDVQRIREAGYRSADYQEAPAAVTDGVGAEPAQPQRQITRSGEDMSPVTPLQRYVGFDITEMTVLYRGTIIDSRVLSTKSGGVTG